MNGRVVALHQAPGAVVAMGDVLLTLEAMKMEHAVCANCAGTVVALHVAVGDQVTPGKLLAQIAPAKGATHAHP
jgi:biotin carboxyl carrier protein